MKLLLVFFIVFCSIHVQNSHCFSFGLKDIYESAKYTAWGVFRKAFDIIPTPEQVFEKGKNAVAGLPFEMAFKIINICCSATLSLNLVKPRYTPNISEMHFVLKYNHIDYLVKLESPVELWTQEKFNPEWPLVLFATGWTTNYDFSIMDNEALDQLYEAHHCRGGINFVTVDSAAFVDTLYTWSAFNTDAIGEKIGEALDILIRYSQYPLENIHLVGHSLGAHIVGAAGKTFYEKTGRLLPRITGLDPANPCFIQGERLNGLSRGDAEFVDIIHTNPGVLGKREPIGDIDFYPNGLNALPPGCFSIVCGHMRAWEYYAESVYPGNEHNFLGKRCASLGALHSNVCNGKPIPMGFAVPKIMKGDYFLNTNMARPYGQNHRGNKKNQCNNIKLAPQVTQFDPSHSVFSVMLMPRQCTPIAAHKQI